VTGLYLIGDLVVGKKGGSIITAFNSAVHAMRRICMHDLPCNRDIFESKYLRHRKWVAETRLWRSLNFRDLRISYGILEWSKAVTRRAVRRERIWSVHDGGRISAIT